MITGMHAIVFSPEADKVRTFFADVLGMSSVDAGGGWLIFALPPAELAVHPVDGESHHELYLMCDNIQTTLAELRGKGVEVSGMSPIRAGGFSRPSACPTARSFPFMSPGTHHLLAPDGTHSSARGAPPPPSCRVLIGTDDRFFPAGFQRRIAKERLGIDTDEIPGGHLVELSKPSRPRRAAQRGGWGAVGRKVAPSANAAHRSPSPVQLRDNP